MTIRRCFMFSIHLPQAVEVYVSSGFQDLSPTTMLKEFKAKRKAKRQAKRESKRIFNRISCQTVRHPTRSVDCSEQGCSGWSRWDIYKIIGDIHYPTCYEICIHRQRRLFESHRDTMTTRDIKKAEKLLYHRDFSLSCTIPKSTFEQRCNPPPVYTENAGDKHISAQEHEALVKEVKSLRAQFSRLEETLTCLR